MVIKKKHLLFFPFFSLNSGARREKKASRFSDPTDTVNKLRVAHGSIIYDAKQNAMTNKIDSTKISFTRTSSQYDEHKDSDSSSNSSKQRKRRKSNNSSSGDSGPDSRYYNKSYRKQYNRSKDKNQKRSRSTSSERNYRMSHNYRNRGSPNRKLYNHDDKETSSSKELYSKSSSSQRDNDRTRSYSNSSSKEDYSRKRSRSRSSSKSSKYNYSRY